MSAVDAIDEIWLSYQIMMGAFKVTARGISHGAIEIVVPDSIDVLLLGMGEDEHIASLFPGSAAFLETTRRILPVIGPKPPKQRLTITPLVIKRAKTIFLLATGAIKGRVLARAFQEQENISALPIQLLLNATWILDHDAVGQLPKSSGGIHP